MHYFKATAKLGQYFEVSSQTWKQLQLVLRFEHKQQLIILYDQSHYLAEYLKKHNAPPQIRMLQHLATASAQNNNQTILIMSLIRQQKWNLALQKCVELGIDIIVPYQAQHSVVKIDAREAAAKQKRWQTICDEAAEQSRRLVIPQVKDICYQIGDLKQYLQFNNLICVAKNSQSAFINDKLSKEQSHTIAIGPEGGFSSSEIKDFKDINFQSVTLGQNILRSETAAIYVASILKFLNHS